MEMGLHNKPPDPSRTAQTESKHRLVLFQVERSPPNLSFVYQIGNFVPVVHLVPGPRRELIDLLPR
jgi:hypothetical protein